MTEKTRRFVEASQTLGAAYLAGQRPRARCLRGKRLGPVKVEACGYAADLDFESIIWTRGAKFPCWRLADRLKCPVCGGTSVVVDWQPGPPRLNRSTPKLYQCHYAAGDNFPDGPDQRAKATRSS